MFFCTIHSPMMLNNTPEHDIVRTVRMFTPAYSIFTATVLACCARSEIADLPAATPALPAGSWHLSRTQWGQGSRPVAAPLPLRVALGPYGSPRAAGGVRPRGHDASDPAARPPPRAARGGRRIARTPLMLTDAAVVSSACGTRAQRPGAASQRPNQLRPRPPRQRSAAAERRLFSGICACGTWQAGPSASGEARPRG
jgi:hypothetical protein